jgi:hypothetical protein
VKRIYVSVVCGFALAALPTLACADLQDPFYKEAKEAYMKHDCEGTLTYLAAYRHKDAKFLARNPEISAQIKEIEAFCYAQAHRGPPEGGRVTGQGAPPPIHAPGPPPSGNAGAPPPPYSPGTAPPSGTLMPPIVPPQ